MINKTDYMIPRTCPEVKKTSIIGPDDWKTGREQNQHLNIYTDGSKIEEGVGAGLYCTDPEIRLSYKQPSDCSRSGLKYKPTTRQSQCESIGFPPTMASIATRQLTFFKGGRRADERQNGERAYLPPNATKRPGETGGHESKKQVGEYQDLPNLKNYVTVRLLVGILTGHCLARCTRNTQQPHLQKN